MKMNVLRQDSIVGILFSLLFLSGIATAGEIVRISTGKLHGSTQGSVTSFKGIPYAAPPVGKLRWHAPLSPAAWTGVRESTQVGPACLQPDFAGQHVAQSEDCLTVNVWRPASAKPGVKLPVMVWIYGGGFLIGDNGQADYDLTHFAEHGVVAVNLNYRVGRAGFLAHPAFLTDTSNGTSANFGVRDVIAALKWVQKEIPQFGGDAQNVTIFGQSAGGVMVNLMMTMPEARGLFQKAIAQSAFGRNDLAPISGNSEQAGYTIGEKFAKAHGITGNRKDAADALRALPAQVLVDITSLGSTSPVVDGELITETPSVAFAAGHEAPVPYITGGNSGETSMESRDIKDPALFFALLGTQRDTILAVYEGTSAGDARIISNDASSTEPARYLAEQHFAHGQKSWAYYFSYVPEAMQKDTAFLKHGGELSFVFGNKSPDHKFVLDDIEQPPATPEDLKISDTAINFWVNFAKHGDPGTANGIRWPQIQPNVVFMEFGPKQVQARDHFRQNQLDAVEHAPPGARVPRVF